MENTLPKLVKMKARETHLKGCFVIEPRVIRDDRGYFYESFRKEDLEQTIGHQINFVQDNQSSSSRGVLRGLHFQIGDHQQANLVRVAKGSVLDVCVDLRKDSDTFKQYFSMVLDDKDHKQLFIPRGLAHGFLVLEDDTIFSYKCDNYYNKSFERGIIYNDPELDIDWNIEDLPISLSDKDKNLPSLQSILEWI